MTAYIQLRDISQFKEGSKILYPKSTTADVESQNTAKNFNSKPQRKNEKIKKKK